MRVKLLTKNPNIYSCNVYLVRGNWNAIDDVNTLIDVGTDNFVLEEIAQTSTGVGKRGVEQIILTHEHFDHTGGLKPIIERYKPKVYAFSKIPGVDVRLKEGMKLKIGDSEAQILHTPGHSHDSVCIYCLKEEVLFSGDTQLNIKTPGGSYSKEFVEVLKRLSRLPIKAIYSGHDDPAIANPKEMIYYSLENVLKSKIID
jgi:glyoxylase-like metal-dependent hydrolase (beta-lactamase superfamily II)